MLFKAQYLPLCITYAISHSMQLMAESGDTRYQCYFMETDDLNDPAGLEMMLDARRLDFPYAISEGTRKAGIDILRATLNDPDQASFILWDSQNKEVVGRSIITYLSVSADNTPEITGLFVKPALQGQHLVDVLYEGQIFALSEAGYGAAKVIISRENMRSVNAATRNGFYPIPSDASAGLYLKKTIKQSPGVANALNIQSA
mgnify:CR=1 FL=1